MRLVFLGKLSDVAPPELADVPLPGEVRTLADLKAWVARVQPLLGRALAATPVRLIVNHSVAHDLSGRQRTSRRAAGGRALRGSIGDPADRRTIDAGHVAPFATLIGKR